MASGSPDWVRRILVTVNVELTPVIPQPATERAAGDTGRYNGSATTYQEVAKWTVATGKVGELKHITLISNNYSKTYFKITVGSVTYATDWAIQEAMVLAFEDTKLSAGSNIKVEAESTDGTAIVVDIVIVGKEIG